MLKLKLGINTLKLAAERWTQKVTGVPTPLSAGLDGTGSTFNPGTKLLNMTGGQAWSTERITLRGPTSATAESFAAGALCPSMRFKDAESAAHEVSASIQPSTARGRQSASGISPHRVTGGSSSAHAAGNSRTSGPIAMKSASMFWR